MTRAVAISVALAALALTAADKPDTLSRLEGHYSHSFANHMVDGERYRSTDTLDIIRNDATHAAVDVHLEFVNGHECNVAGVAKLTGADLVLTLPQGDAGDGACTVTFTTGGGKITLGAEGDGCFDYCGARGSLDGAALPIAGRKPITHRERAAAAAAARVDPAGPAHR